MSHLSSPFSRYPEEVRGVIRTKGRPRELEPPTRGHGVGCRQDSEPGCPVPCPSPPQESKGHPSDDAVHRNHAPQPRPPREEDLSKVRTFKQMTLSERSFAVMPGLLLGQRGGDELRETAGGFPGVTVTSGRTARRRGRLGPP